MFNLIVRICTSLHECQCFCERLGFICSNNNQAILYGRGSRYALDLAWRFAPCSLSGYSVRSAEPLRRRVLKSYPWQILFSITLLINCCENKQNAFRNFSHIILQSVDRQQNDLSKQSSWIRAVIK